MSEEDLTPATKDVPEESPWTDEAERLYELGLITPRMADIRSGVVDAAHSALSKEVELQQPVATPPVNPRSTTKPKRKLSQRELRQRDVRQAASIHKPEPWH